MDQLRWLNWVQDRGQWLTLLDTVMNVLDLNKLRNFRERKLNFIFTRRTLPHGVVC